MHYPLTERFRDLCAVLLDPQQCVLCGGESRSGRPLCSGCLSDMMISARKLVISGAENRCGLCGAPLVSSAVRCVRCKAEPALVFIDRVLPLFPYTSGAQELLGSWKIEGIRGLSHDFAAILAECLAASLFRHAVLVPVPPRPGKIREKGWDQIEELARILEYKHGIPVLRCLERTSHVAQKTLDRLGRKTNLKGHISVRKGAEIPFSAVLLDDLMTTGATLDACAEALKNAGCGKVCGLTLFFD